jgi:sugar lactone lactonase YvrE
MSQLRDRTEHPTAPAADDHAAADPAAADAAVGPLDGGGGAAGEEAMPGSPSPQPPRPWLRRALLVTGVSVAVGAARGATAAPAARVIVLPGASSTEGIAVGRGATFYAGDLLRGDIFRGDLQRGTAERFIAAPAGRMANGLKVDVPSGLLFVAGGATGQAYVYDTATGATVATYQLGDPAAGTLINDVALTRRGAWYTDSTQPRLYVVPIGPGGTLGAARPLALSGPAADTSGPFNVNGITATPDGSTLIVAHSTLGQLLTVDPATGASAAIDGVSVPGVDGIVLDAGRLWAVLPFANQIAEIRLRSGLRSGVVEQRITSAQFQVPTTVARHGDRLAVVNAKFDTGFPPTAPQYEVVVVGR